MNLTCEFDGIIVFYDVFFRFYEVWALKSLLC